MKEKKPVTKIKSTWWAVMKAYSWESLKAYSWESLEVLGLSLRPPPEGPCKFIPLFETRAQAVAFDNGCEDHVREVMSLKANGVAPSSRRQNESD